MAKKKTWKIWAKRLLLVGVVVSVVWMVNLVWFKPFNIEHFYNRVFVKVMLKSPELITQLGVPVLNDWKKDALDDASDQAAKEMIQLYKDEYATLQSYDYDKLSEEDQLNVDVLGWYIQSQIDAEPFMYYTYPVNQYGGVQSSLPSLMESSHKLESKSDIKAYISRLAKFGIKFDQVLETLKIREEKGFLPPTFIIDNVITEMNDFMGLSEENPITSNLLYTNFEAKVSKINSVSEEEKKEYSSQVAQEIKTTVFPAYRKMVSYFKEIRTDSNADAGAWKFPNGKAYYRYALKANTTTEVDPEKIYHTGLREIGRIKTEMWDVLTSNGITDTTLTLQAAIDSIIKTYPGSYLDTRGDNGPQNVLDRYRQIITDIEKKTDSMFDLRPKAELIVRRVPEFKEGGTGAYYQGPAMDGSRPGFFFANLSYASEQDSIPNIGMKTLAYHEGIPGHHFQIALQNEMQGVPTFRTVVPFTAYAEGWALYSEQLGYEMGMYDNDPMGNLGRLQAELFRAVRLVVDTGLHSQKWARNRAIEYMMENAFMSYKGAQIEVDRYIVNPGQACAYKIGMLKILELRERTKTELGDRFNIREFHNTILRNGQLPLDILEEQVDQYISEKAR